MTWLGEPHLLLISWRNFTCCFPGGGTPPVADLLGELHLLLTCCGNSDGIQLFSGDQHGCARRARPLMASSLAARSSR